MGCRESAFLGSTRGHLPRRRQLVPPERNQPIGPGSLWLRSSEARAVGFALRPADALGQVVVHYPERLHGGVDGCRADEAEAELQELLRECLRFVRGRRDVRHHLGCTPRAGFVFPDDAGQRGSRRLDIEHCAGVLDRRRDLPAVADDRCVAQAAPRSRRRRTTRPLRDRTDRTPRGRLRAFARIVIQESPLWKPSRQSFSNIRFSSPDRSAPFVVVVADVLGRGIRPGTPEVGHETILALYPRDSRNGTTRSRCSGSRVSRLSSTSVWSISRSGLLR